MFELKREKGKIEGGKGLEGGGIAIGVSHALNPVLTRQGDDEAECLSVVFTVEKQQFLCVAGYGPQLSDHKERKEKFWKYMDEEVKSAKEKNIGLIIQMDSNAWVGADIIPGDPNKQNSNGKLMKLFLEENPALIVVNSLSSCEGTITRQRKTTKGLERSILDVYIVCPKVLLLIKHMQIDHMRNHGLSNFKAKNVVGKVTSTDHHPVILTLDLSIPIIKHERESHYNFKDKVGQMMFQHMTENSSKLEEALSTDGTFQTQVTMWEKQLNSFIYQSFPKIRHRKRKFEEDEVGFLLEERKKLKRNPPTAKIEQEIDEIEKKIASKTENQYNQLVKETLGEITGEDGRFNGNGLWKKTRRIFPTNKAPNVIALEDKKGNIITNYSSIRNLALNSITERLRKRPIQNNLKSLEKAKTKLTKLRLKIATRRKSNPWEMQEMQKAIQSMKNNKCRDAYGLVNEILKPGVAGKGFLMSLLSLLNKTKELIEIPHVMKNVNIALIPKPGKRNLKDISNHRGIFLIPKYRSLIMRMLLNDEYNMIDAYMSDSNVGGRKDRSIRDHLFIVNGVLHEHSKSKTNPISIQIVDYKNCFDSLWQDEITNEPFDAGVQDDKLALLHKINETNNLRVKTPAGISDVRTVKNNICQGDPWGSIQCGVMVDGFGKDSLAAELEPYKYKGKVPVPLLGMVDDILSITESGYKTRRMNLFLNAKTAIKRLQFGPDKCHIMHVGRDIPEFKKDKLFVDGWEMIEG